MTAAVVLTVPLAIAWSMQLLQCVSAVGADMSAPRTPDHRMPADRPATQPVHPNAVNGSAETAATDVHPALTTGSPLLPVARYPSTGSPYYMYADYRRETDIRRPDGYSANRGSTVDPRWNRYHHGGYRQLKKYQVPVVVEMDEDVDYDDVHTGGGVNDVGSDKSTGDASDWYDERPGHGVPDHGHHHHWTHRPGHAVDVNRLTTAKIVVAKLKAAKAVKIILLLAAKLKMLVLFKLHLFTKLFAVVQTLKLLNTVPGPWPLLANANVAATVIANVLNALNAANAGNVIGAAAFARCGNTSATGSRNGGGARESRTAGAATSAVPAWTNGFLSYLVDYIRNRNLKSLKSSFEEVSGYRSKN